jgi:hypothetical protein
MSCGKEQIYSSVATNFPGMPGPIPATPLVVFIYNMSKNGTVSPPRHADEQARFPVDFAETTK